MIKSKRFICILDTNVLFPVTTRNILLWFAYYDLYVPKWSEDIISEVKEVMIRKGLDEKQIEKQIGAICIAFDDAEVFNYRKLIESLDLPDKNDKHILAAAIKINANVIVTNNLQDFPEEKISAYGISAKGLDDFLTDIIDLDHETAVEAFKSMVLGYSDPDLDEFQVLDLLRRSGLKETANFLHSLI